MSAADTILKRGTPIPPQGEGGYDQNWYPICLSADLQAEQILAVPFMNGKVIAVRGADGKAAVLSPFCRHLGASLEIGALVDGKVRCPFHHWLYDMNGLCVGSGIGDKVPENLRLVRFPTHEAYGMIWAFNGETPLYDPPFFVEAEDNLEIIAEISEELPVDHFVPFSNATDVQHLKAVHGIDLDINPQSVKVEPHGILYVQDMMIPQMGQLTQNVHLFGTNALTLSYVSFGKQMYMMACGRPVPGNRTQTYNIAASPKGGKGAGDAQMVRAVVEQALLLGRQLAAEDSPIMKTMRFSQDTMTASDRLLTMYLGYVRKYPRSAFARDMIS